MEQEKIQLLLHDVALRYLARFASSKKGLKAVLLRYIRRKQWQNEEEVAGISDEMVSACIDAVIKDMEKRRFVDDKSFAYGRLRSLRHSGHSLQDIRQRMMQKGVAAELFDCILRQEEDSSEEGADVQKNNEVAAALVTLRKRRLGPFKQDKQDNTKDAVCYENSTVDHKNYQKARMVLARAGFSAKVAQEAIVMEYSEAEERIFRLKNR